MCGTLYLNLTSRDGCGVGEDRAEFERRTREQGVYDGTRAGEGFVFRRHDQCSSLTVYKDSHSIGLAEHHSIVSTPPTTEL